MEEQLTTIYLPVNVFNKYEYFQHKAVVVLDMMFRVTLVLICCRGKKQISEQLKKQAVIKQLE